jgi:EAL domain-containing protein (putative c-di-GMP-specific phosphodiesterase class I)
MVSISRANRVHRPERVLAYIPDESFKITNSLYNSFCPQELLPYLYSFGTYDGIGTYRLSPELAKEKGYSSVVGLEFRPNDPKVKIPENLDKITIPENDYLLVRCIYDGDFDYSLIVEAVDLTLKTHPSITDKYEFIEEPVAVSVYLFKDQILVLYPINIVEQNKVINEKSYSEVSKKELFDFAQKDFITNYYNWTFMNQKLSSFGKEGVTDYCFVHFNVKDFNMINELFNHQAGNNHLCAITERIEECKEWIYFGARCDNDNFALMIKDMPDDEIVEKLTDFFAPISYLKENPSYKIYYRCGVVTMMNCLNSGRRVSDYAKIAQSLGKKNNQTEIVFYTKEMHDKVMYSKQIKAYLDTALRNEEFFIYLQPKINVETNTLEGAEALVRWNFKTKEILSPAKFIPYFETDDSISKIDTFVLKTVCKKLNEWKKQGLMLCPISVNLSRKQIEKINIVEHIREIVDSYEVNHSLIDFELTESAAIDNTESIQGILGNLKSLGFKISVDDFGTGYSSFSLLKDIPCDTLKIDKSFVDNVVSSDIDGVVFKDNVIIKHIISLTQELGYKCIAEGAETKEQVERLKEMGCKVVQGYYFSKPIPMEEFEKKYLVRK